MSGTVPTINLSLDLIIVLGTYERRPHLEQAIASIRKGITALKYEIVVVDGGSATDGTRAWLADQPDVVLLGHRGLRGAVEAFNHGFAYAVDRGAPFIANLNDDVRIANTEDGALDAAVARLRENPELGAIAFAFDLFTHSGWGHDHVHGLPYINFGVTRREAGMAAARAQGDPSGRCWWNPIYHTYACDCELGVWIWKLGWKIEASQLVRIEDKSARFEDVLRENNRSRDHMRRDTKLFYERWSSESLVRDPVAKPTRPVFSGLHPTKGVRRILITGGHGFLGSWIVHQLGETFGKRNVKVVSRATHDPDVNTVVIWPVDSKDADLRDPASTRLLFDRVRPDVVIHAAARVGGIGANVAAPVAMFADNMAMGMNVLAECARHPVRRLLLVGTTCSYPLTAPLPFHEATLDHGRPEPTNAPYGVAKRALIELAEAYRRQHGLETIVAMPTNLYGEGDTFADDRSHVIAAILKKIIAAKIAGEPVTLWGTGLPTRDLLHVEDAARGVVHLLDQDADALTRAGCGTVPVVNLGTGVPTSIASLADTIATAVGFMRSIHWDTTKPDGQPQRSLMIDRAKALGWSPTISLERGLPRLIDWYQTHASSEP